MEQDDDVKHKCPVCYSFASLSCSLCKEVVYCSKEHQKFHWKFHKKDCRTFDIVKNEEGHWLITNRDLEPGRGLLQESPLVVGPRQDPVCLGCLRPVPLSPPAHTCQHCAWPVCSPDCPGLSSPNSHLPECLILRTNAGLAQTLNVRYEAILPLRCILLQEINQKKWQQFLSLGILNPSSDLKEANKKVVNYLLKNYLGRVEHKLLKETSPELLHKVCTIIDVSGIDVSSGGSELLAVYPTYPLIQHSCVPNTKHHVRNDLRLTVTSISPIKSGVKLSAIHTNALWGTMERREHLKEAKFFSCSCPRCSDPTELGTNFSTLKCANQINDQQCGGNLLPTEPLDDKSDWKCNQCPLILSSEHIKDLVDRISEEIDAALEKPSVEKLEGLLENLLKFLHKNHFHCYTVKHSLIQLYGRLKGYMMEELTESQLQRKIDLSEELKNVTHRLDMGHGKLALYSGVILYELYLGWKERARRGSGELNHAKKYLEQCVNTLQKEQNFTAGSNLLNIANSALVLLEKQSNL